jgi:RHS repeat-associated protein
VTNADRRFVWCGPDICEEWDSNNVLLKRYFAQGEQQSGTNLFYTLDHLGSIRELTDGAAATRAEYAYAPYGFSARLSGDLEASFGFTGHFRHLPSGLDLTLYRAYDTGKARWLSRDPIAEAAGFNLHAYGGNSPLNTTDPRGDDYAKESSTWLQYYSATHPEFRAFENAFYQAYENAKVQWHYPNGPPSGNWQDTKIAVSQFAKPIDWLFRTTWSTSIKGGCGDVSLITSDALIRVKCGNKYVVNDVWVYNIPWGKHHASGLFERGSDQPVAVFDFWLTGQPIIYSPWDWIEAASSYGGINVDQ